MRKKSICYILCLFCNLIALGQQTSSERSSLGSNPILYSSSHALLIGASQYNNGWPVLPGVEKDINLLKVALEQINFVVEVAWNPDHSALPRIIKQFISKYGNEENSRLIIYFAGHGHTIKMNYNDTLGYILPIDSPDPGLDKNLFLDWALPLKQFELYAIELQAKHVLFLFDACFSGSLFKPILRGEPSFLIKDKIKQPVRIFITSGSEYENVPDESIFRKSFIEAIYGNADYNKDGYVTGNELFMYLETNVVNISKGKQHPQFGKIRNPNLSKGDIIFFVNTNSSANEQKDTNSHARMLDSHELTNCPFDINTSLCQFSITELKTIYNNLKSYDQAKMFYEKLNSCWKYQTLSTILNANKIVICIESKPSTNAIKYCSNTSDISSCLKEQAFNGIEVKRSEMLGTFLANSKVKSIINDENGIINISTTLGKEFTMLPGFPYGENNYFETFVNNVKIPVCFVIYECLINAK